MSKFKIGDKVRCIKADSFPNQFGIRPALRVGTVYIVNNVSSCPKCSKLILDVGLGASDRSSGRTRCNACSHRYVIPGSDAHWCCSTRFVKEVEKTITKYISVPCDIKIEEFSHN